jgi:hypothetical protein
MKYLAIFPWLDRHALHAKVKQDCKFLGAEHKKTLSAKLHDSDILNFYDAWEFVYKTEFDDSHAVCSQDPMRISQGVNLQPDLHNTSLYRRLVKTLKK